MIAKSYTALSVIRMAPIVLPLRQRKAGKQESRKAGKQESRKAGKQESRKAGIL